MDELKKKRYPKDRQKLRDLLTKKRQMRDELIEEVQTLERLSLEADRSAINRTAEEYHVTPEEFALFMADLRAGKLPQEARLPDPVPMPVPDDAGEEPDEKEVEPDDEDE